MHFPRFWTLAKKGGVSAWGWSDSSMDDALARGSKRVDYVIDWIRNGFQTSIGAYGYPNRPMREEVLREFHDSNGTLSAVVSRNSYGCLVLNTQNMLFVDVDEKSPGLFGSLKSFFRLGSFEQRVLDEVHKWIADHPGWGWRVYRTRAGIRLLATHQPISPEDRACHVAFKAFGADWLYQKLCVNQKCFRARITPKPWRCGVSKPTVRWPFPNPDAAARFKDWSQLYEKAIGERAVCRLLGHFGRNEIHPEFRDLVSFHDGMTRIETSLPLA